MPGMAEGVGKRLERAGKAALRAALGALLPAPPRAAPAADPASVRRVLAVRHDARLGNLLLLTPALAVLRRSFPNARIEVLLSDRYGDALLHNPSVDAILTARSLPGLRARGYDLAVDFSAQQAFSLSSAAWTAWSGAPRRVGFERGDAARFLNALVPVPAERAHETANLARLARAAAPGAPPLSPQDLRPLWFFAPGEREEGARTWRGWGLDENSVALFLGARAEKRLPPEWFLSLAERLAESGRRVALMVGPAEAELLRGRAIARGVVVAAQTPLRAFAAAIAGARAVLTADTGPMHLAVAVGTPTVELFSHTEPWRFGYAHLPGHMVLDCAGRHPSVEEAWSALAAVLARPRGA